MSSDGQALLGLVMAAVVFSTFAVIAEEHPAHSLKLETVSQQRFERCAPGTETCVIDGETITLNGDIIKLADIDAPATTGFACEGEYQLALVSRDRLAAILSEGPFGLAPASGTDSDAFGRKRRVLVRHAQSLGDRLVSERLARPATKASESWC